MKILVPSTIGILLIVMVAIGAAFPETMAVAWSGDLGGLVSLITDWIRFGLLVVFSIAVIIVIGSFVE